jgi:hypothetical protein
MARVKKPGQNDASTPAALDQDRNPAPALMRTDTVGSDRYIKKATYDAK